MNAPLCKDNEKCRVWIKLKEQGAVSVVFGKKNV